MRYSYQIRYYQAMGMLACAVGMAMF